MDFIVQGSVFLIVVEKTWVRVPVRSKLLFFDSFNHKFDRFAFASFHQSRPRHSTCETLYDTVYIHHLLELYVDPFLFNGITLQSRFAGAISTVLMSHTCITQTPFFAAIYLSTWSIAALCSVLSLSRSFFRNHLATVAPFRSYIRVLGFLGFFRQSDKRENTQASPTNTSHKFLHNTKSTPLIH